MITSQAVDATSDRAAAALLLAVDAGGSKTSAWFAIASQSDAPTVLGRGRSSSANPLTVGFAEATRAIAEAADQARNEAGQPTARVDRAVLSIAGAADAAIRDQFLDWARANELAERVAVVPDVLSVLAAGAVDCCGVALVVGTGSVALARNRAGRTARRGGWGYLLGDDGSGYAIGRAATRYALEHLESAAASTSRVAERVSQALDAQSVATLTAAIYQSTNPRATVASLAPIVLEAAAGGDAAALTIVESAARDLADLAARAAQTIGLTEEPVSVAAAGGVIVGSTLLQDRLRAELNQVGMPCELRIVEEPLHGCVRLATREFAGLEIVWR